MNGHLKLGNQDIVLANLQNGLEYIENSEIDGSLLNTYLQNGCLLLKDKILRYVYDDFSGGDMQETYSLIDVHYKSANIKIKPQTSGEYSSLAFCNPRLSLELADTCTKYIFDTVLEYNNDTYILIKDTSNNGILTKNLEKIQENVYTIFNHKNKVYIIYKDGTDFKYKTSDDLSISYKINWTHNPTQIIYESPYIYTFDAEGNVRLFSPTLLQGYMPIRVNLIENNIAHIDAVFDISDKITINTTLPEADARICPIIAVTDSEGSNFITAKQYRSVIKNDTLVVECVFKNKYDAQNNGIDFKSHMQGPEYTLTRISADAFGYSDWLNSGNCENVVRRRKEARPSNWNGETEDLIITNGTFYAGEQEPIFIDEWLDNVEDVEVPIKPIFKIYWKSIPQAALYYQFFIGEEIDLGLIAKEHADYWTNVFPEQSIIIKVTDKFPQNLGFSVGDKWYIPMYKDTYADGQIELKNAIPPSIKIEEATITNNPNIVYSSISQTNQLPIIQELDRNEIDKYDYSYSLPNSRLVIHRPEFGGRISAGGFKLSYYKYNNTPKQVDFIAGELANRKILFNECYGDIELSIEEPITILSNSKEHINLRIQPKTNNVVTNTSGSNATIIQNDDDIIFKGALKGTPVSVSKINGQIFVVTKENESEGLYYTYLINRSGLAILDTIEADYVYGGIDIQGTILYSFFKNGKFNIALLGGEVIYTEEYNGISNVYYVKKDDKIFVIYEGGIVCVQQQTTNNYYSPGLGNYICGFHYDKVYYYNGERLKQFIEDEKVGMIQTSFASFGKDGFVEKRLNNITVKTINGTETIIQITKNHEFDFVEYTGQTDYTFRNISIFVFATADAIESITIDFEPDLDKKNTIIFTAAIHQNVLDLNGNRLYLNSERPSEKIQEFIEAQSNEVYDFIDIDGKSYQVTLDKLQIKGTPQSHKEHGQTQTDKAMYLVTFYLTKI